MNDLKRALFSEIRKTETLLKDASDDELNALLFRTKDSLRLSKIGFIHCKTIFTTYSFKIPAQIKTKHFIGMEKFVYPYYISKSYLILFSSSDAMMIQLQGGIELFLENLYKQDHE